MGGDHPSALRLELWHGDLLVAVVSDAFVHQGTWFGGYRQVVTRAQGAQAARLCDYIAFDEQFHRRMDEGENPDPSQYDQFRDVLYSGRWRARCPDGSELAIPEGPGFGSGQVCWHHPEGPPSRERAAWEVWSRLTGRT